MSACGQLTSGILIISMMYETSYTCMCESQDYTCGGAYCITEDSLKLGLLHHLYAKIDMNGLQ